MKIGGKLALKNQLLCSEIVGCMAPYQTERTLFLFQANATNSNDPPFLNSQLACTDDVFFIRWTRLTIFSSYYLNDWRYRYEGSI